MTKPEVQFIVSPDNLYFAYLKKNERSDHYVWDEEKHTKEEFLLKYKDYNRVEVKDD